MRVHLAVAGADRRDHVQQAHHLVLVRAGALEQLIEPLVDLAARPEHHVGLADGGHVARARLVAVGVGARLEQPGHLDPVAAHLAHELGNVTGRRHHAQLAVAGRVVSAAGRRDGRHEQQRDEDAGGTHADGC